MSFHHSPDPFTAKSKYASSKIISLIELGFWFDFVFVCMINFSFYKENVRLGMKKEIVPKISEWEYWIRTKRELISFYSLSLKAFTDLTLDSLLFNKKGIQLNGIDPSSAITYFYFHAHANY